MTHPYSQINRLEQKKHNSIIMCIAFSKSWSFWIKQINSEVTENTTMNFGVWCIIGDKFFCPVGCLKHILTAGVKGTFKRQYRRWNTRWGTNKAGYTAIRCVPLIIFSHAPPLSPPSLPPSLLPITTLCHAQLLAVSIVEKTRLRAFKK